MSNIIAMPFGMLKYGPVSGGMEMMVGPVPVGATEYFTNLGGKIVLFDGSRRVEVADSGDGTVFGYVYSGAFTSSATEGLSKVMVNVSPYTYYYLPTDAAVTIAMRGQMFDLINDGSTTSQRQRVDVGEGTEDIVVCVDVDIQNQAMI